MKTNKLNTSPESKAAQKSSRLQDSTKLTEIADYDAIPLLSYHIVNALSKSEAVQKSIYNIRAAADKKVKYYENKQYNNIMKAIGKRPKHGMDLANSVSESELDQKMGHLETLNTIAIQTESYRDK